MGHSYHQAPDRSGQPSSRLTPPARFEWTRQPGTGPRAYILGNLAGATVIELGCGGGHNLAHLVARHGVTGIGIDADPAKINRARAGYGHLPAIRFIIADARRYLATAVPGSADVLLSIFGVFSFTDAQPILPGAARMLRPGGLLAVTLRADEHHDTVVVLRRR
jgi:trans-aconitate methyltransferase